MADFEFLAKLRAAGIKSATFDIHERVTGVEFFPVSPSIPALDFDTLVPPPPEVEEEVASIPRVRVPPALAAILKNGSVS